MTFREWAIKEGFTYSNYREWSIAAAGWDAAKTECAKVAGETLISIPFTGDHEKSAFGLAMAKEIAEAIIYRIEDIG